MHSAPCNCIVLIAAVGEKKDDPLPPAYLPSLLSFTPSRKRKIAELSLYRCTAANKGRKLKSEMKLQVTLSVMHSYIYVLVAYAIHNVLSWLPDLDLT